MRLQHIDHGERFDWGRASVDYAAYRDIYPDQFFRRILELGLCGAGQTVLDIGTGTGVLPRHLHRYGARFVGVDIAENQIAQARGLSRGMDITYIVSPVEEFDYADGAFDVVTACQCLPYFNMAVLAPRLHRMLRAEGHFCALYMAWLPGEDAVARRSEELVLRHNPAWTGNGWKRAEPVFPAWAQGLFELEHAFCYDLRVPFTRESWNGRIRACRGVGASSLSDEAIAAFEREHLQMLEEFAEPFTVLHEVSVLNLRKCEGE